MPEASPDEGGPNPPGCALALAAGPAVVAAQALAFAWLTGRPLDLDQEWGVLLVQVAIVAAPFLLLSLAGTRDKLPWLAAAFLTLALWGWVLFDGVRYQWSGDKSGANIGLGLIMLASPFVITGASMGLYAWRQKRRQKARA
jgi:hypothetical protein